MLFIGMISRSSCNFSLDLIPDKNPLIVIDPHMNPTSQMADVVFPAAFVGIETPGTAYRMDHVPLPLKKVVDPPRRILSDEEILRRILSEVRKIRKRNQAEAS